MPFELLVIGASLGGGRALTVLLAGLPADFPLPVAVVQHRHKNRDTSLRDLLRAHSPLLVEEAEDKAPIRVGRVYLAPADYHLLVEYGSFALSTEAPVISARPSIDVLFESVAASYGPRAIGVILTGASRDGALGLAAIKARGGTALVQQPATAESPVMPEAALAATAVDRTLPLEGLAAFIVDLCHCVPR